MHGYNEQERALTTSLRQVAAMDAPRGASPAVKARLLEEVRSLRLERRRAVVKTYALAAGLVIATAMPVWQLSTRSASDLSIRPAPAVKVAEVATGFFPLVYGTVPVTQGSVVRLTVPRTAFATFGIEPVDWVGPQPDVVLADVLVGEDGLARAVRFVRTVPDDLQERLP